MMSKNIIKYITAMLVLLLVINIFSVSNCGLYATSIDEIGEGKIDFTSTAKACVVMDSNTGRVFYKKNENQKLALASTTKIVTAITAIENCADLDEEFVVDDSAIGVYGTSIYLQKGEVLSTRELLYGLMLRSGNDASVAIAIHVGGSVNNFVEMMNNLAKKVGANNSHFVNSHGLDNEDHYTTASDLAKITSYALTNEIFSDIVKTKSIKISGVDNDRYLVNKNKLLKSLDGCIGVKTGFTNNAGRCLVSACERDNLKLVCVVLNCGPMFEESATMFNKVFEKYANINILDNYNYIKTIPVINGDKSGVAVYSRNGLSYPLSESEYLKIRIEYDIPETLTAPINSNNSVGNVKVYYDNHLIFCEKVYTIEDIKSKSIKDKLKNILDNWSI